MSERSVFLFGAGAEVPLGMPLGGEFALRVISSDRDEAIWSDIRHDIAQTTQAVQHGVAQHEVGWGEYRTWLGDLVDSPPTKTRPTSTDIEKVFRSTIEESHARIGDRIRDIDSILAKHGFLGLELGDAVPHQLGLKLPEAFDRWVAPLNHSQPLALLIGTAVEHSRNESTEDVDSAAIWRLVRMFVELAYAAGGYHAVRSIGKPRFENPVFADKIGANLGGIARIDFGRLGIEAFSYAALHSACNDCSPIARFSWNVVRDVVASILDYQLLIEEFLPALYRTAGVGKAKFLKALTLMHRMKRAIEGAYSDPDRRHGGSYYQDLRIHANHDSAIVATTNYTNLIHDVSRLPQDRIMWLNGHVGERLDPYGNHIFRGESDPPGLLTTPHLIAQSVIKPMMTAETIDLYRRFRLEIDHASQLVIVGYGFGSADSHINSIIRNVLRPKGNVKVTVFVHTSEVSGEGDFDKQQRRSRDLIVKRLRLFGDPGTRLVVLPIDEDRTCNGDNWLEKVWPRDIVT